LHSCVIRSGYIKPIEILPWDFVCMCKVKSPNAPHYFRTAVFAIDEQHLEIITSPNLLPE
jgi:hypothetical protein